MERPGYFEQVCDRIKSHGFRVFVSTREGATYGYYSDGTHIGYFQLECGGWDGVSLSTVNWRSGFSGYSVKGESGGYSLDELTPELLRLGFLKYPDWAWIHHDIKPVSKHHSLEHFLKEYWDTKNLKEL